MTISATASIELFPGTQIFEFDSSTRNKTYRVELSDGRHFQINEKLYHLLDCLQLPMSLATLASEFQRRTGQTVDVDQLQTLSAQLSEQGVIRPTDQVPTTPTKTKSQPNSYLALHYRRDLLSPQVLAPMVRAMQIFFARPVLVIMLALIAGIHVLAYQRVGFPPNLQMEDVTWPVLYVVMLVSFLMHELGHLAACQRWQCPHGPLGFGLYFFNPVFYVDVTAAWRLKRWQRAVVDISGIYLQLVCIVVFSVFYWLLRDDTFLLAILLTDLMILSNFEPFMKLDGYWLLSDLTGVPNLHARTGEITKRVWGWVLWRLGRRTALPETTSFSEWSPLVRWVIFGYVALSVAIWPLVTLALIPMLFEIVTTYPGLWWTALTGLREAIGQHDVMGGLAQLQVLFLPTLVLINIGFLVKMSISRLRKARGAQPAAA